MKISNTKTEIRVKRCPKCINNCALDAPRCETGKALADAGDIYEEFVPEKKQGRLFSSLKKRNYYN